MALQKTKTTTAEVSGNYWHITHLNCNPDENKAICVINLYVDSATCAGGYDPIETLIFDLGVSFYEWEYSEGDIDINSLLTTAAYATLKANAIAADSGGFGTNDLLFFKDATIVA